VVALLRLGVTDAEIATATQWWSSPGRDLRVLKRTAWKIKKLHEIGPLIGITAAERRKWRRKVSLLRPADVPWQQEKLESRKRAVRKQGDKRREARQKRLATQLASDRNIALLQMLAISYETPVLDFGAHLIPPSLVAQARTCIAFRGLKPSSLIADLHRRLDRLEEAKLVETRNLNCPIWVKHAVRWASITALGKSVIRARKSIIAS
jgi:hypothetical protein